MTSPPSSRSASGNLSANAAADISGHKRPCRVTVSEPGWQGARTAAIAAGCSSVSDMLEKLGSGELSIITSDAIQLDPLKAAFKSPAALTVPQHIHIHTPAAAAQPDELDDDDELPLTGKPLIRLIVTGVCAAVIIGSLLYHRRSHYLYHF